MTEKKLKDKQAFTLAEMPTSRSAHRLESFLRCVENTKAKTRNCRFMRANKLFNLCRQSRDAFTLAEVLITLGVIGVVAAMTLPALIQKNQERQFVTALKKNYSILNNAYLRVKEEYGPQSEWEKLETVYAKDEEGHIITNADGIPKNLSYIQTSYNTFLKFKPYLSILKECEQGETGCFPEVMKNHADNLVSGQFGVRKFIVLTDGTSIGFLGDKAIYVDVNGLKKPNRVGEDIFQFKIDDKSIGLYDDQTGNVRCYSEVFACSSWVIINDNMDYLHCDDLSWNGKRKCK